MIVSAPDTHGRYYLLPMLDMWTDVFASPGWRTTGTQAGDYALTPPGWSGALPAGVVRIDAPTPYVWIIGRTKTDGPADYAAVNKIQAGFKITPLSSWGKAAEPATGAVDPAIDMKTPPKVTVDTMPAAKFFAYAAEILKQQPPHITDQPIVALMQRIGIERGKSFNIDKVDPAIKAGLETAPEDALKLMEWKLSSLARVVNGWSMNTDTMGVYGDYYLKRAIIAQLGLGANLPEDAIYPINLADETGKPLDGGSAYVLHFDKGATPPVNAFWSITLYDAQGYQVANSLNRFAVSSWMPFKYNPDGSLDLTFQNASPGADKEANWLPAPKGPFNLTMRLYAPKTDALTGKWNPPPVMKQAQPTLAGAIAFVALSSREAGRPGRETCKSCAREGQKVRFPLIFRGLREVQISKDCLGDPASDCLGDPASYQPLLAFTIETTLSMTGTSIKTPTTVARAAPELEAEQRYRRRDRQLEEIAGADQGRRRRHAMLLAQHTVEQVGKSRVEIDLKENRHGEHPDDRGLPQDLLALKAEQQDERGEERKQRKRLQRRQHRASAASPPELRRLRRMSCAAMTGNTI